MTPSRPPIGSPVVPRVKREAGVSEVPTSPKLPEDDAAPAMLRPAIGSPAAASISIEALSDENRKKLEERDRIEQQEEEEKHRGRVFGGVPEIRVPAFLLNSTFVLMLAAIIGAVGLFIYAQALTIIAEIPQLPKWLQFASYALLIVLCGLVVSFGVRLITIYWRLRETRRIHLRGIDELNARSHLRRQISLEANLARAHLLDYIKSYPGEEKRLAELGFTGQQIESLRSHGIRLVDDAADLGAPAWIMEFKMGYQQVLDDAADACIKRHALRVGLKTAATPLPIADTLIVLYSSFALIGDLCSIYNLRLGRVATLVVTGWAAIQSMLAGRIEDSPALGSMNDAVLNTTGEQVQVLASRLAKHAPGLVGAVAGAHIIGPAGVSAGKHAAETISRPVMRAVEQALVQGVLLKRLGKRTQAWLRMVE